MRYKWKNEALDYLNDSYGFVPIEEIAAHLGVSYVSVVSKAYKLKLNSKKISGEMWSKEEDDIVFKHFQFAPKNFLMNLLPGRTWPSIYQRGRKTLKMFRESQDKLSINYNFFSNWTSENAYVFGLYCADGYLILDYGDKNSTSLQIEITDRDTEILEKVKEVMKFEGNVSHKKNKGAAALYISNKKIAKDLIKFGFSNIDKTNNAKWPIGLPKEYVKDLARGLFDGDGSIWDDTGIRISFLATREILEELKNHFPVDSSTNGILPATKNKTLNLYKIKFSGKKAKSILEWMYDDATIYLKRKRSKHSELKAKYLRPN